MLTEKERLLNALDGRDVDRPPCICPGGRMNAIARSLEDEVDIPLLEAHCDAVGMATLAKAVYQKGLFESYALPFCSTVEAQAMGAEVVLGGRTSGPHAVGWAFELMDDWRAASPIDLERGRARVVLDAISILSVDETVPVTVGLTGPVSVAATVMEFCSFYKALRKKKAAAHEYLEFVTGELVRYGRAQIEAGADVIVVNESLAAQEIMGPVLFRDYAVPYLQQLQDELRRAGARTIVYCFGRVPSDLPQIGRIDSNALAFGTTISLAEARKALPGRVLVGGVPIADGIRFDAERARRQVRACMASGADIIAPEYGVAMDFPVENIDVILQTVKEVL